MLSPFDGPDRGFDIGVLIWAEHHPLLDLSHRAEKHAAIGFFAPIAPIRQGCPLEPSLRRVHNTMTEYYDRLPVSTLCLANRTVYKDCQVVRYETYGDVKLM
jgi:hypothetical protein